MLVLLLLMVFVLLATLSAAAEPGAVWINAPEYVEEEGTFDSNVVVVTAVRAGRLNEATIPVGMWKLMGKNTIRVLPDVPGLKWLSAYISGKARSA